MVKLFAPKRSTEGYPIIYGRNNVLFKVQDYILGHSSIPENVALLGVKGVGKSAVIKNAFCKANIKKYFDTNRILVKFVSISDTTDSMKGFYSYLYSSVFEAIDYIESYDKHFYDALAIQILDSKNKILERCVEIDDATMESVLNKTIDIVKEQNLHLLFVIDDFERFADSSNLKKAQYKYLRELANSKRISLFITTGQDLTKVSEEMKGSGFENIFYYEELRGLKLQDVEDWIFEVTDQTNIEFSDELIEWIESISGGIPAIIEEAAEMSYSLLSRNILFNDETYKNQLYSIVYPLLEKWWQYTDAIEHHIFKDVIENRSISSINRDCLIKKGYLNQDIDDNVFFVTPLFKKFVLEKISNTKQEDLTQSSNEMDIFKNLLQDIVKKANGSIEAKIEKIDTRISGISEQLSTLITEVPSRDNFYREEDGSLDPEKYGAAISAYISEKLTNPNDDEICDRWNINKKLWAEFSNIRKNDCAMAYRLITYVFSENIQGLDYTPVTVMLGNFLEGLLNDYVINMLKKHLPDIKVKYRNGSYGRMADYKKTMTIGGFEYIFRNEDVSTPLCNLQTAILINLKKEHISDFSKKLSECHKIRNMADHPGKITTYQDRDSFVNNMFYGENSMIIVMNKLSCF